MSRDKDAKRLAAAFDIAYTTALRLVREHGLEAAIDKLEARKLASPIRVASE